MKRFKIFVGRDHYNRRPVYQVMDKVGDYVGEFHKSRKEAQEELKDLMRSVRKNPMKKKTRKKVVRRKRRSMREKRVMQIKRGLMKRAKKLHLGAKRTGAYVYGTLRRIVGNPDHRTRIALQTVRRPMEGYFLGGPDLEESVRFLLRKGYTMAQLKKINPDVEDELSGKKSILPNSRRGLRRNRSLRKNEGLGYTSYIPESGFLVAKTTGYHDTPSGKFQLLKKGQVLRILFTTKERRGGGTTGKEYFVAETTDHPYEGMKVLVEKGYAGKIYNSDPRKSSSRYGNRLMGNPMRSFASLHPTTKATLNKFLDYVYGFYGKGGVFARQFKNGGFNRKTIERAIMVYIDDVRKGKAEWGDGDSVDRERVRMILEPGYSMFIPEGETTITKNPPMYAHRMMSHRTHGLSLKQMMKLYRMVSSGNPKAVMFARRTLGIPMSESLQQVKAVVYHHVLDLKGKI